MTTATTIEDKALERRLRREATRKGYILCKSRSRNPRAEDFGKYVIVGDVTGNRIAGAQAAKSAFANGHGTDLVGVEDWMTKL